MSIHRADDGAELFYEDSGSAGEGLPLVLLPGMLGSLSEQWVVEAEAFATHRRVLRLELRGHGHSRAARGSLSPRRLTADLLGLLDAQRIERCHLAGYSLGGYLGLALATREPDRIASLLMHGTKFYWQPESVATTLSQLDPATIRAKVPRYALQLEAAHGPAWAELLGRCADLVTEVASDGLTETDLRGVTCPTLVSVGDRDALVPVEEARRLQAALPQGQLLVMPAVGHPFGQVPTALLQLSIERLLATVERPDDRR